MSYVFTCPHCQTRTRVEDRYSGRTGQCVTCGKPIEIPSFVAPEQQSPTLVGASSRVTKPVRWIAAAAVTIAIAVLMIGATVRFGGRTISRMQDTRDRNASNKNLEAIAKALRTYASDHGSLPPPVVLDANNQPLYSWRVLLLPYLDEEDLYIQFDLQKPWDEGINEALSTSTVSVYQNPSSAVSDFNPSASAYYLITGPRTLFPESGPLRMEQIGDGLTKTILVVEAAPVDAISWAQPMDLSFPAMSGQVGSGRDTDPGGHHDEGAAVVTADGRGHFLPKTFPARTFRSLVTPNGSEPLADDVLD